MGAFFRPVLGGVFLSSFGCRSALKRGGFHIQLSSLLGEDSVGIPLANEGVGLGPSSFSGPVASRPPLADRPASAASSTHGASPGIPHCC